MLKKDITTASGTEPGSDNIEQSSSETAYTMTSPFLPGDNTEQSVCVGGGGAFSSLARILGVIEHSFPACAFFFFLRWRLARAH